MRALLDICLNIPTESVRGARDENLVVLLSEQVAAE